MKVFSILYFKYVSESIQYFLLLRNSRHFAQTCLNYGNNIVAVDLHVKEHVQEITATLHYCVTVLKNKRSDEVTDTHDFNLCLTVQWHFSCYGQVVVSLSTRRTSYSPRHLVSQEKCF